MKIRHEIRKLKYLFLALLHLELPFKNLLDILEPFEDHKIRAEHDFNKIVFIGWITNKITISHFNELKKFRELNPDWKFYFIPNDMQEAWMSQFYEGSRILEVQEKTKFGAAKSDIFRYLICGHYGAMFFSVNIVCTVPLSHFLGQDTGFVLSETGLRYNSSFGRFQNTSIYYGKTFVMAVIASSRNHGIIQEIINMICERYDLVRNQKFSIVDRAIWWYTGPYLLTDAVLAYLARYPSSTLEELKITELPFNYDHSLYRPESAKFRYIFQPSYIGYSGVEIAD